MRRSKVTPVETFTFDPGKISRISVDRTTHCRNEFGRGFMTLRQLCSACYLQGIADVAATMADRPEAFVGMCSPSPLDTSKPFDPIELGM